MMEGLEKRIYAEIKKVDLELFKLEYKKRSLLEALIKLKR